MNIIEVDEFEILENHGEMGIKLPLEKKLDDAVGGALFYDGKNCAILLRNNDAFVLPNIVYDVREKLHKAKKIIVIETIGDDIVHSYEVGVKQSDGIPYKDDLDKTFLDVLQKLSDKYGADFVVNLTEKIIGVKIK